MTPARSLFLASSILILAASGLRAQTPEGKRPGILSEIRKRLSIQSPAEIYQEARNMPLVREAEPLMESLARRKDDPVSAARAALWLGHLRYGGGETEDALGMFELAVEKAPEGPEAAEAAFWVAQCGNLLGLSGESPRGSGNAGVWAVLSRMVRGDGDLRVGRFEDALHDYLGLEGDSRRAGCLSPLFYRLGLVAAAGVARGGEGSADWEVVRQWEPSVAGSPERALVAALAPAEGRRQGESAPAPGAESAPDSAEVSSEPPSQAPAASTGGSVQGPSESSDGIHDRGSPESEGEVYFTVQLGAFTDQERAAREAARLTSLGLPVRVDREESEGDLWWKIRLGKADTRAEADALARRLGPEISWRIVRIAP